MTPTMPRSLQRGAEQRVRRTGTITGFPFCSISHYLSSIFPVSRSLTQSLSQYPSSQMSPSWCSGARPSSCPGETLCYVGRLQESGPTGWRSTPLQVSRSPGLQLERTLLLLQPLDTSIVFSSPLLSLALRLPIILTLTVNLCRRKSFVQTGAAAANGGCSAVGGGQCGGVRE